MRQKGVHGGATPLVCADTMAAREAHLFKSRLSQRSWSTRRRCVGMLRSYALPSSTRVLLQWLRREDCFGFQPKVHVRHVRFNACLCSINSKQSAAPGDRSARSNTGAKRSGGVQAGPIPTRGISSVGLAISLQVQGDAPRCPCAWQASLWSRRYCMPRTGHILLSDRVRRGGVLTGSASRQPMPA